MLIIVSDASVLIDIECGKLSSTMFKLPWQFTVPDILFAEELAERHQHLLQLGLKIKSMDGELIAKAYHFRQRYTKPSTNDLLALVLAQHEDCQLLTGDRALRTVAQQLGIEVHGTIWLIEQMMQCELITTEITRTSFQHMRNAGSRLPWDKVEKVLNKESIFY